MNELERNLASTRDLWAESFLEDEVPALPCPWCDRGNLQIVPKSLKLLEPEAVRAAQQNGDLSPLDAPSRFSMFLKCAVSRCGNIVAIHGDALLEERAAAEQYDQYVHRLYPKGMYPAPPLATIPSETPQSIQSELNIAFSLFWIDLGSCANRLRISVERIMDEFGLPPGRLFDRIQQFQNADPEHAQTFDALRHVGNVGSHDGEARREVVLDAFEIYQDALAEIFGKRKARIAALKAEIIKNKGK